MHPLIRSSILLLLFPIGSALYAQHAFQVILPGVTPALKRPIVQTPDGGFCVLGETSEEVMAENGLSSFPGTVLIKTNSDGTIEWTRSFTKRALEDMQPIALRSMPDGGFIAVVNVIPIQYRCGMAPTPDSRQDIMVMRLNAHGYPLWTRTYRVNDNTWASDAVVLEDGSAVITGAIENIHKRKVDDVEVKEVGRKGIAFRIDPEGEVLWNQTLIDLLQCPTCDTIVESFGEAVCSREGNAVTVAFDLQRDAGNWSSLLLTFAEDGKAQGEGTWLRTWNDTSDLWTSISKSLHWNGDSSNEDHSVFINDLASLSNGGYVVAGIAGHSFVSPNAGFLAELDSKDSVIWSRRYVNRNQNSPFTSSVLPFGDGQFLITGRTPLVDRYESGKKYDSDLDDPIIALTDRTGALVEAKQFVTSLEEVLPISEDAIKPAEAYLRQPQFALTDDNGIISVAHIAGELGIDSRGLFLARFNPDITTCGDETVRSLEVSPNAVLESTRSKSSIGDHAHSWEHWMPVDVPLPNDYLPPPPQRILCALYIDQPDTSSASKQPVKPTIYPAAETTLQPIISHVAVSLGEIAIESEQLTDIQVKDREIDPFFLCSSVSMIDASSIPAAEESVEAEYLHVLPNSIQKGKSVAVEFRMRADRKPEVNLISVGRGEVVGRLNAKSIMWSEADGTGGATIETAGIAAGVYLVQIRSGERQLSAKLEVR